MWIAKVVIASLSLLKTVESASSGIVGDCNVDSVWGCTSWLKGEDQKPDRLQCSDTRNGIMDWVAAPVASDKYTLRPGDGPDGSDATSYRPGDILSIYIRTLDYDYKWRGLSLYAQNSQGQAVGEWQLHSDENNPLFHTPSCPTVPGEGAVLLHVSAEIKPFKVRLQWKAPAAGAGSVTFKALIKRGPANHGWFYFPNDGKELTLSEGSPREQTWYAGVAGQTCTQVCDEVGKACNAGRVNSINTEATFEDLVSPLYKCLFPAVSSCQPDSPTIADSMCHYPDGACEDWRQGAAFSCDATSTKARICPCGAGLALNAASTSTSALWRTLGLSAAALLGGGSRTGGATLVLAGVFASLSAPVSAHNWVHTPGRASRSASTVRPCLGRKSSDLHVQVGPGQDFTYKWATGHTGGASYVVTVAGKDAEMLASADMVEMLNDYIENAPANTNTAKTDSYQRYHGVHDRVLSRSGSASTYGDKTWFSQKLDANHKDWLTHPRTPTEHLYKYTPARLERDVRVSYQSTAYPWLLAVFKFPLTRHLPADYDAIKLSMPSFATPGHHIVHWRWNGYFDCMDVDYRAANVPNVYGVIATGKFVYNKVDHCQYMGAKEIASHCFDGTLGADRCMAGLTTPSGRPVNGRLTARYGINIVPAVNPSSVHADFKNSVNIPWADVSCANSPWTLHTGTVSQSSTNWAQWKARSTRTKGRVCDSGKRQTSTLMQAVQDCSAAACVGVSWNKKALSDDYPLTGKHSFKLCTASTAVTADPEWDMYVKKIPVPTDANGATLTVSFARAIYSKNFGPLPSGWVDGTGEVFGVKVYAGGKKYGWKCDRSEVGGIGKVRSRNTAYLGVAVGCGQNSVKVCAAHWCDAPINTDSNEWEIEVDNGLYEVTLRFVLDRVIRTTDCYLEGQRLFTQNTLKPPFGSVTVRVEVRDGRLSMGGNAQQGKEIFRQCDNLNRMEIKKVGSVLPSAWLPSNGGKGAWMQMDLGKAQPIGLVALNNRGRSDCGSWWLFQGDRCPGGQPLGFFPDAATQGAVVGISDTPCTDANGCAGTVCGRVDTAWRNSRNVGNIDCAGKSGRYAYVFLPGADRVLGLDDFKVNKPKPDSLTNETMVCYGVVARQQTETVPEYLVSTDPEDPIFYSTCYVREQDITWLPTGNIPMPPKWHFNGECLTCKSFEENQKSELMYGKMGADKWVVADKCIDCEVEKAPAQKAEWVRTAPGARCGPATCSNGGPSSCLKNLLMSDGERARTVKQCQALAVKDASCGITVDWNTNNRLCRCFQAVACCGSCTPATTSAADGIYELKPN